MEERKYLEEIAAEDSRTPTLVPIRSLTKRYVEFDAEDPLDPRQWALSKRYESQGNIAPLFTTY
jgi:hypothetical protein